MNVHEPLERVGAAAAAIENAIAIDGTIASCDTACEEGRAGWCQGRFWLVRVSWRAAAVVYAPRTSIQAPERWVRAEVAHVGQLNAARYVNRRPVRRY